MHALAEFATDLFLPRYRAAQQGAWELQAGGTMLAPGYWSGPALFPDFASLLRDGELWMSLSPLEVESQEIGIRHARGTVVIFGLGMGWATAATAARDGVERVIVVERDPDVLALHAGLDLFAQLPPAARARIRIEQGDAYAWRPDGPVDLLMPDIWLPLVNDGRMEEVHAMQANVGARAIYFWGQELEIARHAAAAGRAPDAAGVAATIAESGLPLIGQESADYPAKIQAAADRWMRGRWLPKR